MHTKIDRQNAFHVLMEEHPEKVDSLLYSCLVDGKIYRADLGAKLWELLKKTDEKLADEREQRRIENRWATVGDDYADYDRKGPA